MGLTMQQRAVDEIVDDDWKDPVLPGEESNIHNGFHYNKWIGVLTHYCTQADAERTLKDLHSCWKAQQVKTAVAGATEGFNNTYNTCVATFHEALERIWATVDKKTTQERSLNMFSVRFEKDILERFEESECYINWDFLVRHSAVLPNFG
jgi:hypothetical protein